MNHLCPTCSKEVNLLKDFILLRKYKEGKCIDAEVYCDEFCVRNEEEK